MRTILMAEEKYTQMYRYTLCCVSLCIHYVSTLQQVADAYAAKGYGARSQKGKHSILIVSKQKRCLSTVVYIGQSL